MKNAFRLTTLAVALIALAAGTANATEGVSPGALDRMAQVNNACPTFSWGMGSDAVAYDVVAYALPEDCAQIVELTADTEVLFTRVAGSATSWTPSAEQCFAPGGRYVWFVRAVSELADEEVLAASEWSPGRYFTVPAAPSAEEMRRALDVLRRWDAANGDGEESALPAGTRSGGASPTLRRSSWGGVYSGTDADAGSAAPKSVPTAAAAIRGAHPDTSGEAYGLVGTSASPYGAGVAAANLDGGPDLVLDGSADAEPDARLYEWGLERESATDWNFQFVNPGAGALNVEVDGTVAATGLECPDCVTSAEIANLSITGADLADDSVTGAKIGDGTVDSADLAAAAVTGIKIAAEAVDSGQIRAGAVESTHLADGAVTSTKLGDRAVSNAKLGNNAVTTGKIADGAIATADLADGAVTSAKILNGSITWIDLAEEAVGSFNIEDGGVRSMDIEAGAVGTAHLADDSVTSATIADGTITAADLGNGSVNTSELVDGAVGSTKISAGGVAEINIAPFVVTNGKIADHSVSSTKLTTDSVTGLKILDGTITAADVDPTGGLYSDKSALYVVQDAELVDPGLVVSLQASCLDANDLPLHGSCQHENNSSMRVWSEDTANWDNPTSPATIMCDIAYMGGVVAAVAMAEMICITVD